MHVEKFNTEAGLNVSLHQQAKNPDLTGLKMLVFVN